MSLFRRLFAVAGCAALMIMALEGCGSRGGLSVVSGEVTYDGRPVQQGTINFFPADGHGPTAAVQQMSYSIDTLVHSYLGNRKDGRASDAKKL